MSQLRTLIWLKWTLFRNSLRTSKAVVNRLASVLTMGAAFTFALLMALGLGFGAFAISSPSFAQKTLEVAARRGEGGAPTAEFLFFAIFSMSYLLWVTLGIGPSKQFDPGNLLLYPISFRKLFAVDFVTEVASLQSVLAIPSILAIGIGVGLARGHLLSALLVAIMAAVFGLALSKWISTSIGQLLRNKRTRGETLMAVLGAAVALAGVSFAQIAPIVFRYVAGSTALRWTPPGAIAFAFTYGLMPGQTFRFILAIMVLSAYTFVLVGLTYWLIQRGLPGGGRTKRRRRAKSVAQTEVYKGLELPLAPSQLSAVVEKELRYASRNAQLRMMAVMPLILIAIRLMNQRFIDPNLSASAPFVSELLKYGEGLIASGGILYVFLILTGLSCNLFAFENAGMRTLILSPVDRRIILLGKNLATTFVALILSSALLFIDALVFRDLTWGTLLFSGLSFLIYAALISVIGNWLSIRFPKRMKIGTRMNVSGVVGLLLIPMIFLLGLPPMAAIAAGFMAQSLVVVYATLATLAMLSIGLYLLMIGAQGELLQQRELELLEAINDPGND